MVNRHDLAGQTFGRLTVIADAGRTASGSVRWLCRCECGGEKIAAAGNLKSGTTASCGCLRAEDLTGQTFGRLTVAERVDSPWPGKVAWRCVCECGDEKVTKAELLKSGHTGSCGCRISEPKAADLTGLTFSRLTVAGRAGSNWHGSPQWRCVCECGNGTVVLGHSLRSGNVKSCGCAKSPSLVGSNFGLLTVVALAGRNRHGHTLWSCACQCGGVNTISTGDLNRGTVRSCGCLNSSTGQNTVYLVAGPEIGLIKVGITAADADRARRLAEHRYDGFTDILRVVRGFADGAARQVEQDVLMNLRASGFDPRRGREYFDYTATPIVLRLLDRHPLNPRNVGIGQPQQG